LHPRKLLILDPGRAKTANRSQTPLPNDIPFPAIASAACQYPFILQV
jgi:hypothetical protein